MEWVTGLAAPVITGLVTLLGMIVANRKAAAVREVEEQAFRERVEAKLDEHNEYGKKFGTVSEKFETVSGDIGEMRITLARVDERLKNLEEK